MPQSEHVHKSMLLRGAKFPTPMLDRLDVEGVRNRSARGGRSYGGAPLHVDNYRPGYNNNNNNYRGNHHRGGYDRNHHHHYNQQQHQRTPHPGNNLNPENPFAAHLKSGFASGAWPANGFPPPPPPPQMAVGWGTQQPNYNGGNQSYGYNYGNSDRGGMGQYWQAAPRNHNGYGGRGGHDRSQGSYGYGWGNGNNSHGNDRGYNNNYSGRSRGGYGR